MILMHLIIAVGVAVILSAVLTGILKWRRPGRAEEGTGPALLFLFFFLLLPIWAIGAWMVPAGPLIYGSPWLGFVFVGLLLALMILALTPARRNAPKPPPVPDEEMDERMRRQAREETGSAVATAVVWLFAILAIALIISAYAGRGPIAGV